MEFLTRPVPTVLGEHASAVAGPRLGQAAVRGLPMAALAMLVAVGCAPAGGTVNPAPGPSTGGTSDTGGRTSTGSGGTGNSVGADGGFQGGTGGVLGTGGSAVSRDAGAGSGGADAGSGPGTSSTGGADAGSGGRANTGTGGANSTGGRGGSSGPITAPIRDASSTQPVASVPSGYKVESNFAYGPLATQRLDVLYPNDAGPKGTRTLPAVLMFHGGGWVHNFNDANGKDRMSTFSDRFLAHGFMVFTAEYRVANSSPEAAFAPAAVTDALLAAKWCWDYMDYFHGDKTRYVVTGASAGGHLAMMVGMTTPAAMLGPTSPTDFTIAAIVDGYGPADIESELGGVASGWLPASLPNRAAVAKLVNPMTYVRMDIPPMIAVQGANDTTAPVAHTRNLVARLTAEGADVSMHEVAGAGHGFTTPASAWPDAEKAMFDWLTAHGIGN